MKSYGLESVDYFGEGITWRPRLSYTLLYKIAMAIAMVWVFLISLCIASPGPPSRHVYTYTFKYPCTYLLGYDVMSYVLVFSSMLIPVRMYAERG